MKIGPPICKTDGPERLKSSTYGQLLVACEFVECVTLQGQKSHSGEHRLAHEHFNLRQLRDNLFVPVPLVRHSPSSVS
jgi:hypothetical protein